MRWPWTPVDPWDNNVREQVTAPPPAPPPKPSIKGRIVKVHEGVLKDKYVMIVKKWDNGYSVVPEATDWPTSVPTEYNAIYVKKDEVLEVTEEEQTMLRVKFPSHDQYE